jgi:hypothetical protein
MPTRRSFDPLPCSFSVRSFLDIFDIFKDLSVVIRSVRSLEWIVAHSPFSLYSPRQTGDVGAGETVPSAAKRNAGTPGEIIIVEEPVSAGKASPGLSDLNPEQNALCSTRRSGGS